MSKYIDADKLIAEIERRQEQLRMCCGDSVFSGKEKRDMIVAYEELDRLRYIITSLKEEQPEVDLEKEIDNYFRNWEQGGGYDFTITNSNNMIVRLNDIEDTARHFYELGLNARKEE